MNLYLAAAIRILYLKASQLDIMIRLVKAGELRGCPTPSSVILSKFYKFGEA